MREVADERVRDLRPKLERLRIERGALAANPKAEAEDARESRKLDPTIKKLNQARQKHSELLEDQRRALASEAPLAEVLEELSSCEMPAKPLADLAPQFESLDAQSTSLTSGRLRPTKRPRT